MQNRLIFSLMLLLWSTFLFGNNLCDTLQPVEFFWKDTFCSNQLLFINNHLYGPDKPSGTETIVKGASNGCDSIIYIDFTFAQPQIYQLNATICSTDTLWVAGEPYYALRYLGTETIEAGALNGCDSIIEVSLTVIPAAVFSINDTLCANETIIVNGETYDVDHPFGVETIQNGGLNGCDSTIIVQLAFRNNQLSIGPDREISLGDTLCLKAQFSILPQWFAWTPAIPCADTICTGACVQPLVNTTYRLTVMDQYGCTETAATNITVSEEVHAYAPNIIQIEAEYPNNTFFIGTDRGINLIRALIIADRWGEIVFQKENLLPNKPEDGWNGNWQGKKVQPGTYSFLAELELLSGKVVKKRGGFTVIR